MNTSITLLIALIAATLLSGLAEGFSSSGTLSFAFAPWQACAGLATAVIALAVMALLPATKPAAPAALHQAKRAPMPDGRHTGTVKWFNPNKGFGFITCSNGDEVFVHYRSIEGSGRRILKQDQQVSFLITQGDKGPQAEEVRTES